MADVYKDASHLYEVERRVRHAEREGFRINELTISTSQQVPWHYHSHIRDTFYVLEGQITVHLRDPKQSHVLRPSETFVVEAGRPHLVINSGDVSATFLVLQGVGEYDYIPLV